MPKIAIWLDVDGVDVTTTDPHELAQNLIFDIKYGTAYADIPVEFVNAEWVDRMKQV